MNRATRRRLERELERTRQQPGVGQGWRRAATGRRYAVREHTHPIDVDTLMAESEAVQGRLGGEEE